MFSHSINTHSYSRQICVNALPVFLLNSPESVAFINYVFTRRTVSLECFQDLVKLVLIAVSSPIKRFVNVPGFFARVTEHNAYLRQICLVIGFSSCEVPLQLFFISLQFWATLPIKDRGSGGLHTLTILPEHF